METGWGNPGKRAHHKPDCRLGVYTYEETPSAPSMDMEVDGFLFEPMARLRGKHACRQG